MKSFCSQLLKPNFDCCFSVHAILPKTTLRSNFLGQSNTMLDESLDGSNFYELCILLHYGYPLIKVVASFCLLELCTGISNQKQRCHGELKCNTKHLKSVMAVLECLLLYHDNRVAVNCSLCLCMIFEWEMVKIVDGKLAKKNKWCRLIVEELATYLTIPSLVSKSCSNNQAASIYIAITLLKLKKVPGWMRSVFDDTCINGLLQNLSGSSLSTEMVLLFRELMNAGFLNAEHVGSLNRVFQVFFSFLLLLLVVNMKSHPFASVGLAHLTKLSFNCPIEVYHS
ncbi:hypothetical protein SAY86_015775 [Trapa natans]|uniref:Uncharacterized protein n=1 Tax=Trapa natans TaxID=22666 RepID=A0AAN7LEW1_TRANT|nr:hypothetical protein SAY86_015775 [Trapa natans]